MSNNDRKTRLLHCCECGHREQSTIGIVRSGKRPKCSKCGGNLNTEANSKPAMVSDGRSRYWAQQNANGKNKKKEYVPKGQKLICPNCHCGVYVGPKQSTPESCPYCKQPCPWSKKNPPFGKKATTAALPPQSERLQPSEAKRVGQNDVDAQPLVDRCLADGGERQTTASLTSNQKSFDSRNVTLGKPLSQQSPKYTAR